jgi:hypothetical protein
MEAKLDFIKGRRCHQLGKSSGEKERKKKREKERKTT